MALARHFRRAVAVALLSGLLFGLSAAGARAVQLALVDRDVGHALLFRHGGNCYAVLPSHVARGDRFSLEMPLQRLVGSGTAFLRDDATDLALAYVEGEIAAICRDPWQGFARTLDRLLVEQTTGELLRLGPEGVMDRTAAQIFAVTPSNVVARTTDALADGQIMQGSSGSVLLIGGRVAGIALRAPHGREAIFLRMDEIVRRLGGRLGGSAAQKAAHAALPGDSGFRITGWTGGGTAPEAGADGGLLAQPYVVPWTGDAVRLDITLDPKVAVPLGQVAIGANPGAAADQSPPRTLSIDVNSGPPGQPWWRSIALRDVPPNGQLTLPTGGLHARQLRITVLSLWYPERGTLRIDSLSVE